MDPGQRFHVGTSGFSYPEWKGGFYPEKLPARDYLSFYARHFTTTEINNTFYRSPSAKTTAGWSEKVPDPFRFTLKLNRRITHKKRLQEVDEEMGWFLKGSAPLADKLGTFLVQLPPFFKEDRETLSEFLETHGDAHPLAFEFRHPSWFCDTIYIELERHQAALVVTETDEQQARRVVTGPFLYLRLRKSDYSRAELESWADWVREQDRPAFAYLKHDRKAPELARTLQQALVG